MVESEQLNKEIARKTLERLDASWYKQPQIVLAFANIIAATINIVAAIINVYALLSIK
jgi:hypothetical protein